MNTPDAVDVAAVEGVLALAGVPVLSSGVDGPWVRVRVPKPVEGTPATQWPVSRAHVACNNAGYATVQPHSIDWDTLLVTGRPS